MPWKYRSDDNFVEIIVDPDFTGDLFALASARPVWIVDSQRNAPRIDAVWELGPERDLFEVSRFSSGDSPRIQNLIEILGCLDDHHPHHNIVVHGLSAADVCAEIEAEGFRVSKLGPDGFVATQDASVRDRIIGRA